MKLKMKLKKRRRMSISLIKREKLMKKRSLTLEMIRTRIPPLSSKRKMFSSASCRR